MATQSESTPTVSGLEGVEVATTRLSDVDGERGNLLIGGYPVEELTGHITFEDVCALLLDGELPDSARRIDVVHKLGEGRSQAFNALQSFGGAWLLPDGMDALRASTAQLSSTEFEEPLHLIGAVGFFAAAWLANKRGQKVSAPNPEATHASDYLSIGLGSEPTQAQVQGLDAYLVTVSDHGMNASTFTARVVASTGSDRVSAVVAGIGALKGPLHGGAPGPVLDMLDAIGAPEQAAKWIETQLVAGQRIMGMGHRIYRVRDPRAAVLESTVRKLFNADAGSARLALARAVENAAEGALRAKYPDRPLRANVEFYTAVLLDAVGLPRELFAPTFGASRVAGWCAHVNEQRTFGKLIRPQSRFVGAQRKL